MTDAIAAKYADLEDPGIRAFMIEGERLYPADAVNFTLAEQRAFYDRYCAHFRKARPPGIVVKDFAMGDIACRRYTPEKAGGSELLYLHGGGIVVGSLDSHDDICAEISAGAEVEVMAVHYRLAPEHPFPAAFDDCWAVLRALTGDGAAVVLAGDSSGGALAAALSLKARDQDLNVVKGQVLIYPGLGGDTGKGSYVSQATAPGFSTADVIFYRDAYKGWPHTYASPLQETDFRGLPPAFLVAAGLDPCHDDCFAYAGKLRGAGGQAQVRDEPLLVHAFLRARHMSRPAASSFKAIIAAVHALAYHGRLPDPLP